VSELDDAAEQEASTGQGGAPSETSTRSSEPEPEKPSSLLPSPPRPAGGEEIAADARCTGQAKQDLAGSPRSRSGKRPTLSLFRGSGQEIWRSSPGRHAHATSENSRAHPSPPLGGIDGEPPGDIAPQTNSRRK
jgi:hypothetical protein